MDFQVSISPTLPRVCISGEGAVPEGLDYFPMPNSFTFYFQCSCMKTLCFLQIPHAGRSSFLLYNLSVFLYIYLYRNIAPKKEKAAMVSSPQPSLLFMSTESFGPRKERVQL